MTNIIQLRDVILHSLDQDLANDVALLDVANTMKFISYMIIASGTSKRHTSSIAHNLLDRLKKHGLLHVSAVGFDPGHWIVVDADDILVHIFMPEVRVLYDLENLWRDKDNASRSI